MSDDTSKRGPQDRNFINVHEKWEVDYWTRTLGVSEDELKQAVAAAGTAVKNVREHLGSH